LPPGRAQRHEQSQGLSEKLIITDGASADRRARDVAIQAAASSISRRGCAGTAGRGLTAPPVTPESIEMSAFLRICLYIFAACAALGLLPAAILAARARQPVMIVLSLLIATFVIFVLVASATELPRH
jgi:hypothetical protein